MKNNINAKEIALAGVTSALAVLFSALSVLIEPLTATFCMLSAITVMMPVAKGMYRAAVLTVIASTLLLLIFVPPVWVLPFALVFGGYTVFTLLAKEKNLKNFIAYPIKIVWINAVLALFYFATNILIIDYAELGFELKYGYLAVIVTLFGLIYDFLICYIYKYFKNILNRFIKFM